MDEREFELVNIIGAEIASTQRDLSRHLDLSLGTTNMLIRRLIAKGYIRIKQLNKQKVNYLLTSKGFAEKMRKSVKYTVKTINSITYIKENLKKIIRPTYDAGHRNFVVLGRSDFALLIQDVLADLKFHDCQIQYVDDLTNIKSKGVLLIATEKADSVAWDSRNVINLIHELAKLHPVYDNGQLIGEKDYAE